MVINLEYEEGDSLAHAKVEDVIRRFARVARILAADSSLSTSDKILAGEAIGRISQGGFIIDENDPKRERARRKDMEKIIDNTVRQVSSGEGDKMTCGKVDASFPFVEEQQLTGNQRKMADMLHRAYEIAGSQHSSNIVFTARTSQK